MTADLSSAPLSGSLFKKPGWLNHATEVGLTFAVKTYVASLLALYIAFWLGLDDPRWSFLTVFVVSQPDSGFVLTKSFYRVLGTIAGLFVTTALVFALAQYGELFVIAVAIWICFCSLCRPRRCAILRHMAFNWPVTQWRSSASRRPFSRMEPILWW